MAQAHILIPYNSWACCAHQSSPKNTEASHIQNVAGTKLYGLLITVFKYYYFLIFLMHVAPWSHRFVIWNSKCIYPTPLTCPEKINIRMLLFILFNMWRQITWSPLSGMYWNPIHHLNLDFHILTMTRDLHWQCRIKNMNIISSVLVGTHPSPISHPEWVVLYEANVQYCLIL